MSTLEVGNAERGSNLARLGRPHGLSDEADETDPRRITSKQAVAQCFHCKGFSSWLKTRSVSLRLHDVASGEEQRCATLGARKSGSCNDKAGS